MYVIEVMVLMPIALGMLRRLLGLPEGGSWTRVVEALLPFDRLLKVDPWCAWWLAGAAVHGLCRGEWGDALTGTKYCNSVLFGLPLESRSNGGVASRADGCI